MVDMYFYRDPEEAEKEEDEEKAEVIEAPKPEWATAGVQAGSFDPALAASAAGATATPSWDAAPAEGDWAATGTATTDWAA